MPSSRTRRRRHLVGHKQNAIAVTVALAVLLAGVITYVVYHNVAGEKDDFSGNGNSTSALVRVDERDTISSLSSTLVDKKIVSSRRSLMNAAKSKGNAVNLQQGYYVLHQKMSSQAAIDALMSDEARRGVVDIPTGATLHDVHVVGGQTRAGIFSLVAKQACVSKDSDCVSTSDLEKAAANSSLEELGVPSWASKAVSARGNDSKRLEGLINPGVHIFDPTASPTDILKTLVTEGAKAYEGTGLSSAAQTVGLSEYQLLTAASLVEREAPQQDFAKVARVIKNRLDKPMKLEFDSTVNYGLDEQEVATTNEDREKKTPWNTYAMEGLPATPIASPSLSAVHAMEKPADGDWLYFVTIDKNGTTVFSRDFSDHEAAIKKAQESGVLDSAR